MVNLSHKKGSQERESPAAERATKDPKKLQRKAEGGPCAPQSKESLSMKSSLATRIPMHEAFMLQLYHSYLSLRLLNLIA